MKSYLINGKIERTDDPDGITGGIELAGNYFNDEAEFFDVNGVIDQTAYDASKIVSVETYSEQQIIAVSPLIGNLIVNGFEHTIDSEIYKIGLSIESQTNFDGLNTKANTDEFFTQKLSCRKKSDNSRAFKTLNQGKINALYDDAFNHKKTVLDRYNTFKENCSLATLKSEVDTEVASIKVDLAL